MNKDKSIQWQLKTKTKAAKRLKKECGMYKDEVVELREKLEKLVADGVPADQWERKNGQKLVDESQRMVRDTEDKLGKAVIDLREVVVVARTEPEPEGEEAQKEFKAALAEAEETLQIANT